MFRILTWIVMAPLAAVLVAFAVSNRGPVALDLWPLPFIVEVPVYLALMGALLAGFLIGGLVSWLAAQGARRRAIARVKDRDEAEKRQAEAEPAAAPAAAPQAALTDGRSA